MKLNLTVLSPQLIQYWGKHPFLPGVLAAAWILTIGGVAFFWQLGSTGLVDETEPLFAEAARQMVVTGDWITPFFNGEPRFDKPPLIYWLMAIAYQIIGVNEWAVRLPSALAALALVSLSFYVLRGFGSLASPTASNSTLTTEPQRWQIAGIGATVLALTPQIIIWGRTGVSDMLLAACLGGALLAFFAGYAQPEHPKAQARWYWAFYTLVALAVLTKGPVAIVLAGFTIGSFLLYVGKARSVLQEMQVLPGVLLVLALNLPWYGLVIARNGEAYIEAFFGYHNLERFTSVVNRHSAPWYFYVIVVLVGFFPWSAFLPAAIARLQIWRRQYWCQQPRSDHLGIFALFWALSVLGFFTVAVTKLPSYVLPLMPAVAILVALFWSERISTNQAGQSLTLSTIGHTLLLLSCAIVMFHSPELLGRDPAAPNLHVAIRQTGIPIAGALLLGITASIELAFLLCRQLFGLWAANVVSFLVFLSLVGQPAMFLLDGQRQLPLRQAAQTIQHIRRPTEPLVMVGFKKPTLVFYTQQSVKFFFTAGSAADYLQQWARSHSSSPSILVLLQSDRLFKLGLKPRSYQPIQQLSGYQLIRVFPQSINQ
jgi:4-amino-4-deoxy-L-arabinose transferase-like glycosyltransferase